MNSDYDHIFKIVIIGDSNVGKTSLIKTYVNEKFEHENIISTIGVDLLFKTIKINNKNIKLQIWDTAGQERFKSLTTSYYKSADGFIVVFDITDKNSFENIKSWLEEIKKHTEININKPEILLVSTKLDLEEKRAVLDSDVEKLCQEYNLSYTGTSSKLQINVNKIFSNITQSLLINKDYIQSNNNSNNSTQKLNLKENKFVNFISSCIIL